MKMRNCFIVAFALGAFLCLSAGAEVLDRPGGFKIGERLTLRPYVSLSFTYDSNVRAQSGSSVQSGGDCMWTIAPTLSLTYNAESWSLLLSGYYNYHQYLKSENQEYNSHNYGQDLRWNWSNSTGGEKGWSLIIGESFRQVSMAEDMVLADGSNYSSDSRQFQFAAALQRRFTDKLHADVNASYYWLDYMNDNSSSTYYGWDRWTVGLEGGYAFSRWTDLIVSGSYQGYKQDNAEAPKAGSGYEGYNIGDTSAGYTVQAGLGSYLTERISYRALAGWSRFEYGDSASAANGFVYTLSGNWKIGETWNTMLLATSYYQPSERQYASQSRVDSVSWGIAKVMVRGKLRATFDVRYRRETNEYTIDSAGGDNDYVLDIWTGRLGLSYSFNRFLSAFGNIEYQRSFNDHGDDRYGAYDYDRWRATIGLALSY